MIKKSSVVLICFVFIVNIFSVFANEAIPADNNIICSYNGSEVVTLVSPSAGLSLDCNVLNVPQRTAQDAAFYLNGTTIISLEQLWHGKSYLNLPLGKTVGANPEYKYVTVEFDFMLETDGTGVTFRMKQENASTATHLKFTAGTDVDKNTWNKAAITYCVDGSENTYSVYLNDKLYTDGNTGYGACGISTTISGIVPIAPINTAYGLYLDNIKAYIGEARISDYDEYISLSDSGYSIDIKRGIIKNVPDTDTVSDLADAVVLPSDEYRKMIVDSDGNEISSQSRITEDAKLVIVNPDGIYKYYTLKTYDASVQNDTDSLNENVVTNTVSSDTWKVYGVGSPISYEYDSVLEKNVIKCSGRESYMSGIQQYVYYDKFLQNTGSEPGDTSLYRLSYSMKSETAQQFGVIMKWYIVNSSGEILSVQTICDDNIDVLTAGEWYSNSMDLLITVPEAMVNGDYSKSSLRIYINGCRPLLDKGDFLLNDFSVCKWNVGKNQKLTINEEKTIGTISENAFGFAYESGNDWHYDKFGGTVTQGVGYKDTYLDYASDNGFKMVRIGGYTSNYELWKRSLGEIKERTAYCRPKASTTSLEYSESTVEYIGMTERVQLAKAYNPDSKIIMCMNIWSAEPNSDNMADETGNVPFTDTIYPVKVFRNLNEYNGAPYDETIDTQILDNAINNALDLIRFWNCEVDDPRAIGSDGTNWAQRRVECGFSEPVKIHCWELGNELYLRHLSADAYITLSKHFIDAVKEVFPEEKLAVHTAYISYYPNWMFKIIEELGNDVDYITTHNYYTYNEAGTTALYMKKVSDAIAATGNDDLKLLITEGGLNTFPASYTGPSNHSIGMSLTFADYFNNLAVVDGLEGFQYYGNTSQIVYNSGRNVIVGWSALNSTATEIYDDDLKRNVFKSTSRTSYTGGMQHRIPIDTFEEELGMNPGDSAIFDFSVKYKLVGDEAYDDQVDIKIHWVIDQVHQGDAAYRATLSKDEVNSWQTLNIENLTIKIPSRIAQAQNAYLRIAINGSKAGAAQYFDVCVADIKLMVDGTSDNVAVDTMQKVTDVYDEYHDTALAELMKQYRDKCAGDIIETASSSAAVGKYVSSLVVKTDNGIRMFLSNLSEENDYVMNLISDKSYRITEKFMQYADSAYAERSVGIDDIISSKEYFSNSEIIENITIPACSVMILDLEEVSTPSETGFTQSVLLGENNVRITGTNSDGKCNIIAAFFDKNDNLLDNEIVTVTSEKINIEFKTDISYDKLKLFKWKTDSITPLSSSETYILN